MSLLSEILRIGLQIGKAKKLAARSIYRPQRNTNALHPSKFDKKLIVESIAIDGFMLLRIQSKKPTHHHLFFLHGGAYVLEPLAAHRRVVEQLAVEYGFTVHFLLYPLAPEHQFENTYRIVWQAYHKIVQDNPNAAIHLLGDSAGGGLALAFLQTLSQQNELPMPTKTALVSPWVDITLANGSIPSYEKKDPILSIPALKFAAKSYAGGGDLKNPLLSPMYGPKGNLGELLLLFGTHELFYPDLKQLQGELEAAGGTRLDTYIGEKMVHDWIVLPIPEAKIAVNLIAHWLLKPESIDYMSA
ncbi:MAG TPA: alpha/beta hydrolase [Anaerovoracaceae bacterium]|nr:alpha/beta hydrolase [Anaerovoracaceae bacterium]